MGDSKTSDGAAVAGFRAAGIRTAFFCCNPKLRDPEDGPTWDDDTCITTRWTDLATFLTKHPWVLDDTTADDGGLGRYLLDARRDQRPGYHLCTPTRDVYTPRPRCFRHQPTTRRQRCLQALELAESAKFGILNADDEDRKVLIAMVGAMTAFDEIEEIPGLFPSMDSYADFLQWTLDQSTAADPFLKFLEVAVQIADETMKPSHGCKWTHLRDDLVTATARLIAGEATLFPAYRRVQRETSINQTDPTVPTAERFMANRAVVDLIRLAKANDCPVVGLTDRPALAIFPDTQGETEGRSLWDTPMTMTEAGLFTAT